MNLSHFFVTGDPMIYGADASIALVSVAIIFYLTRFKKWGWLWREWITTVDHKKNRNYVPTFFITNAFPWWNGCCLNAAATSYSK